MTDAISAFTLTLPAGIGSTQEYVVDCPLGWSDVTEIQIVFPPGPAGNVGVAVAYSGNQVYPVNDDAFFIADNYVIEIDVTNQEQAGQWTFFGYNTDYFQHSIQIWFFYNYVLAEDSDTSGGLVSL